MMKKRIYVVLILISSIIICGCTKKTSTRNKVEKSLYDRGMDTISLMNEMVQSDAYTEMMGVASLADAIATLKAEEYETPKSAYCILPSKDMLDTALAMIEADAPGTKNLPENLKHTLKKKVLAGTASQLNARYGTSAIAASSLFTVSQTFVSHETTQDIIYIYTFEDAYPVCVTFSVGDDAAIMSTGYFIMTKDYEDSEDGIREMLATLLYLGDSTVEKVDA